MNMVSFSKDIALLIGETIEEFQYNEQNGEEKEFIVENKHSNPQ